MKRFIYVIMAAIATLVSCTNLDEILEQLRDHEERIQKLEALCNRLNSNVEAIQTILTALEQNDYVTDIVKVVEDGVEVGYSITFAKGGTVTIYHGTNGADGAAPQISIKKAQDGEYYWTADGEWMTDENGEKIPASVPNDPDGKYITPSFRIAEGVWYISYDGGNTWKVIETEEGEKCPIFEAVEIGEDHYTFYLNDGTVLTVPAYNPFAEISQYAGKIVSLIGDSISTFKGSIPEGNSYYYPKFDVKSPEDTWWSMLIDYMDAQLGINNSWAGSRVTNRSESNTGNIGPDRCMPSIARIESLDDKGTPDIILFYGGTNDVYDTVPLGSFDKNSLHTTVDLERTIWDNFADAYKDAIMRLQHYYPYAQIVCISPTYSNITTDYIKNLDSYISVIKDISDYFGAHFIDLRKCGITLESSKTEYGFFGDVTHPTKEGMKLIAKYIYRQICTMIQYDEEKDPESDLTSQTFNFDVTKGSIVIKYEGYKFETGKSYDIHFEWSELPSVPDGVKTVWKLSTTNDNTIITNTADHLLEPIYWARVDGAIDESKGQKANVQSASLTFTPTQNADYLYFYVQQATNQQLTCALSIKEKIFTCTEIAKVNSGGRNMQGFDIYNDIIFQCCDGGYCRTYDLNTGALIADFPLGSNVSTNHAGGVNFGLEFPDGSEYPALYVSGDLTTKDCYVEKVTPNRSELIQTIHFDLDNNSSFNGAQVVIDKDRKRLIYQQRESTSISDVDNNFHIYEFCIPALDDSEVILTSSDVLCEYVLPHYSPYYQGACIHNGQFLQTHGYAVDKTGVKVGLLFFNMDITDNRDLIARIKFDGLIDYEPQGVTVYNNRLIMSFVNSTYYEIQFKG